MLQQFSGNEEEMENLWDAVKKSQNNIRFYKQE